jgi:hypothetical protein
MYVWCKWSNGTYVCKNAMVQCYGTYGAMLWYIWYNAMVHMVQCYGTYVGTRATDVHFFSIQLIEIGIYLKSWT